MTSIPAGDGFNILRAEIRDGFKHDERIRHLEVEQAETKAILASLPRMEDRLMQAIEANKPKSPWPAVSALAGVLGVFLLVAAALYGA